MAVQSVGADSLVCHVTSPKAPPKCAVSFSLPGGYLFFSVTATKTGAAGPEAGGTGRYAHTTGNIVATGISQTKSKVIITCTGSRPPLIPAAPLGGNLPSGAVRALKEARKCRMLIGG